MTRLLPLLALAFACQVASAQPGQIEIQIMFETVVGDGPAEARTVWKAPAGTESVTSIAFGRARRFSAPIDLRLQDQVYVGTGRVPPPSGIRAIRVTTTSGTLTVRFPQAGWDEGVAAARFRYEPREGDVVTGEGRVYIEHIPSGAQFNLGMPPSFSWGETNDG